jgi:hypothetical protein
MPEPWVAVVVTIAVGAAIAVRQLLLRRDFVVFENEREESLTRRVAGEVGCTLAQALPAVRREVQLAPNQPDQTLVKRAAYHYRQNLPERTCSPYPDRSPG